MKKNSKHKIIFLIISILIFTLFLVLAFPIIGTLTGMFNIFPLIIISWFYGFKGGLIGGLLLFPYVIFLYSNLSDITWSFLLQPQGIIVIIIETTIGISVGTLSSLRKKLHTEINERKRIERHLEIYANIDFLTNTLNRRAGLLNLQLEIDFVKNNKEIPLSIAYIDINSLKYVNDTLGHDEGDLLIKKVVEIIKRNIKESDTLVRLSGDEFLLIMPNKNYLEA